MIHRTKTLTDIEEIIDRSNLLRAVLLFIGKDKNIWDHEKSAFVREGMAMGYEKEFCEAAVRNILANAYINQNPPVFYNKEYARKFVDIARRIMMHDAKLHPVKINFYKKVLSVNNLLDDGETKDLDSVPQIRSLVVAHKMKGENDEKRI